jgi:hypothetical protein
MTELPDNVTKLDELIARARLQGEKAIPVLGPLPLTLAEWAARDLPEPDFILGNWLSTTSRILLAAPSGLGKTNFVLGLGMRAGAGKIFLHWKSRRASKVLYIDGEMSRRLLKQRLTDETRRIGDAPDGFHTFSHEDVEGFKPLNTLTGQSTVLQVIERIGGVDLVIFDSVMCLISGSMIEEEPWQQTMPFVRELTRRNVGQVWVHHTGLNETRGYGTSTRDWQLDSVILLEKVERPDTDVAFKLSFKKARERTPQTRLDFQDVGIALVNDRWEYQETEGGLKPGHVSPVGSKFLAALINVLAGDNVVRTSFGQRAAADDVWRRECEHLGLIDMQEKAHVGRTLFAKHRRELVAANRVACEGNLTWLIS